MTKDTRRDRVWKAALRHESQTYRRGWTPAELIETNDLEASEKTVYDTLHTMASYGFLRRVRKGSGGQKSRFLNGRET